MTITLHGLTNRQKFLADLLWNTQSADAVSAMIKLMPEPYKHDAKVVYNLMAAAVFDQHEDTGLAESVLDRFRK